MQLPAVGLQCIVFGKRYSIATDAVLDHVAACGYEAVECGVKDPAAFKRMLDERGMVYGGAHASPTRLLDVRPIVESLKTLDAHDVCNSGLMNWHERTREDFARTIDVLNRAGRQLRDEGIHLHYHNHDFEFDPVEGAGGKRGIDLLLEGLDADVVDLCVDVGWVAKAGADPAEFLVEHKDRVGYLHFKDFNDDGWIELGGGKVDFAGVMAVLPELTGARWVMIEQDTTRIDPLDSVAVSRKYLKDAFGY